MDNVPQPLLLRPAGDGIDLQAAGADVMAVSKTNWNNAQLDERDPLTLRTAHRVGAILRHVPPDARSADSGARAVASAVSTVSASARRVLAGAGVGGGLAAVRQQRFEFGHQIGRVDGPFGACRHRTAPDAPPVSAPPGRWWPASRAAATLPVRS